MNTFSLFSDLTLLDRQQSPVHCVFLYATHIKNNNYKNTSLDQIYSHLVQHQSVAYPGIFFGGGEGFNKFS